MLSCLSSFEQTKEGWVCVMIWASLGGVDCSI